MENWIESQGSPNISIDDSGTNLVANYIAKWNDFWAELPEVGSNYPGDIPQFENLVLANIKSKNNSNNGWAEITLTYKAKNTEALGIVSLFDNVTTCTTGILEKPIESHPSYLYKWNHALAAIPSAPAPQSWYDTAKTYDVGGQDDTFAWIEPGVSPPDGFFIVKDATKPGVESYLLPSPVVNETIYYTNITQAQKVAKYVGSIKTPHGNKTFGVEGGKWLVMSADLHREDHYWVVDTQYQWAEDWDTDLYS